MSSAFVMLTDSDNFFEDQALHNFAVRLYENPYKLAYSGYMTCISKPEAWYKLNMVKMIQDVEYTTCEISRNFELALGSVNCLPGAFTAIRYDAFENVTKEYFIHLETDTSTRYHQRVLGEDRYLTHLLHQKFPAYSIGFCPHSRCKTDPPDSVSRFVKQRRRWLLGAVSNEAYMLSTPNIWRKLPLLLTYKIIQNSWRSTTFSQLLVAMYGVIIFLSGPANELFIFLGSVSGPILFAWIVAIIVALGTKRYKVIPLWPVMIVFYTFVYVAVDIYAIWTWRYRSWGGPRAAGDEEKMEKELKAKLENV